MEKVIGFDPQKIEPDYMAIDPEDLCLILKEWKAFYPHKYTTMAAMMCYSAGVDPFDLIKKGGRN